MITLAHLRSLLQRALTHAENPAIVRLTDQTVEGLVLAYLPHGARVVVTIPAGRAWPQQTYIQTASLGPWLAEPTERSTLDLTDPGTAHALLVALALALGHDPGPMALEVMLSRIDQPARRVNGEQEDPIFGWFLYTTDGGRAYYNDAEDLAVCAVAAEPDPIKALGLAVLHVLENP